MSSTIPTENISFSDIRTAYNNSGQGTMPDPGSVKLSDFRGAGISLTPSMIPISGSLSVNTNFKGGQFADKIASGGEISYSGAYTIHTFDTSGSFVTTTSWSSALVIDFLLVGGGGGGGAGNTDSTETFQISACGGGGAGGVCLYIQPVSGITVPVSHTCVVVVGAGGGGAPAVDQEPSTGDGGAQTTFTIPTVNTWTVLGGGGGDSGTPFGVNDPYGNGGVSPVPGFMYGSGSASNSDWGAAGGGAGMGGGGGNGSNQTGGGGTCLDISGGEGGLGEVYSITGIAYGGGGGGGLSNSYEAACSHKGLGQGGGGDGGMMGTRPGDGGDVGPVTSAATAGTNGRGGGGGGGAGNISSAPLNNDPGPKPGANGGNGVVIIRYLTQYS